jgi:uncharacterized membrane protein YagU involved in acid resistance
MLDAVEAAGDNAGAMMAAFAGATPQFTDALYSYDTEGNLPPRAELEESARPMQMMRATLGVWLVANPFAELALGMLASALERPTDAPPESA